MMDESWRWEIAWRSATARGRRMPTTQESCRTSCSNPQNENESDQIIRNIDSFKYNNTLHQKLIQSPNQEKKKSSTPHACENLQLQLLLPLNPGHGHGAAKLLNVAHALPGQESRTTEISANLGVVHAQRLEHVVPGSLLA